MSTEKQKKRSLALRCARLVGPTLEQRKEWHPAAIAKDEAMRRMQTLIRRLRYRGDEYNADIAEMEILPWISGPNAAGELQPAEPLKP